jgi:hypothetical protein
MSAIESFVANFLGAKGLMIDKCFADKIPSKNHLTATRCLPTNIVGEKHTTIARHFATNIPSEDHMVAIR